MIDGSNVMHWKGGDPDIATVTEVILKLTKLGYHPGVVFDANAGYLLTGQYEHDDALARAVGLPPDRVMVVDKGTQADPVLLQAARDFDSKVVTNDRFRDWEDDYPEIHSDGFLIKGHYIAGQLKLSIDT